jgi:hypothetical protein
MSDSNPEREYDESRLRPVRSALATLDQMISAERKLR